MKFLRRFVFSAVFFFTALIATAGTTKWEYAHPTNLKFVKAYEAKKWEKAAKLASEFNIDTVEGLILNDFARAYDEVGQKADSLRCRERHLFYAFPSIEMPAVNIWKPKDLPAGGSKLLDEFKSVARYAQETQQTSRYPSVAAYSLHLAGKSDLAFKQLLELQEGTQAAASGTNSVAAKPTQPFPLPRLLYVHNELLQEVGFSICDEAIKRPDGPTLTATVRILYERNILPRWDALKYADACLKAGDRELVNTLFEGQLSAYGGCDYDRILKQIEGWAKAGEKEFADRAMFAWYESRGKHSGQSNEQKLEWSRKAAAFGTAHGFKSSDWLIQSMILQNSGRGVDALPELAKRCQKYREKSSEDYRNECAFAVLNEILRPAFDQACTESDWATATQVALYSLWLVQPPEGKFLDQILEAIEKSGKPDLALKFCLAILWERNFSSADLHICDPQGDPELVKRAATIAHRHNLAPGDPLVEAWLLHMDGKSGEARKRLRAHIAHEQPNQLPASIAVGQFLMGDISLEQDKLIDALSWYFYGTYRLSVYCADNPQEIHGDSHYHEVLGVARQARVLVKMGKPKLAADEMFNLCFVDPALEKVINRNTVLKSEWAKVTALVAEASRQNLQPGESYREDVVLQGGVPKQRQLVQLAIPSLRKKRFDAEAVAERKTYTGPSRFFQSYLAAEAEAQAAATTRTGKAFDFQGQLDGNKNSDSKRRCASCLGSGKAGYVTGAKYQSTTTGQQVAAPPCSSCNGTGWR